MTRATDPSHSPAAVPSDNAVSVDGHVCPFCGLTREITETFDPATPCPRCTLADTPTTRSATKARIGPWHVRQVRNPWAPGMGFETLIALVKRGQVTKDSIVRGPTTHQLWRRAAEIKGLSREFGLCYSCGAEIGTQANLCAHCNRLQEPPINPDVLVEGRESVPAPSPAPVAAAPAQTKASVAPSAIPQVDEAEPPHIEIGSSAPMLPPDEMLLADEAALARQITSRPPATPPRAPVTPPRPPAMPRPPRMLRPRTPGVDDALLTPQELAQAFQLGFTPGAQAQKRRPKLAAVAIMILLLGGGAAALLSLQPEMRKATSGWFSEKFAAVSGWYTSRTTPRPPMLPRRIAPTPTEEVATSKPHREPLIIAPPPAPEPKSVEVAEPPPLSKPVDPPAPAPEPAAAHIAITPSPAAPPVSPAPVIPIPPPPVAVIPAPLPAPEPVVVKPPTVETPTGDPEEQARTLWRKAIDAEINQDYVEAVACYEKIKKLPEDVQPRGLDVRLDQARKLVK